MVTAEMHVSKHGGGYHQGGSEDGRKLLGSGFFLEPEPTGFSAE